MLNTILFSGRMLALGNSVFNWLTEPQFDFSISLNHALSCCSQSACFNQKFLKVDLAMTLT